MSEVNVQDAQKLIAELTDAATSLGACLAHRNDYDEDHERVERAQQAILKCLSALAPAPASSSGAEAGVLDTTFECDLGDVTMREYFAALLTDLLNKEEMFDSKRPFGNSGWKWELHYPLWQAGLIEGAEDEDGYPDIPFSQRLEGNKLLPALIRQALSLPAAPASAGAE